MRLRRFLRDTDGSSMISVLVAFIILLLGIAGFSRAVTTANDMVRRAEMLNAATGQMLRESFYPDYADQEDGIGYILPVYEKGGSGGEKFSLHGRLRERKYEVKISRTGAGPEDEPIGKFEYDMYFYK